MNPLDQAVQDFQAAENSKINADSTLKDADLKLAAAQTVRDSAKAADDSANTSYYSAGQNLISQIQAAIAPFAPNVPAQ